MHNLYLRKDGRWEGRIRLESDDDIRRYKAFFGRTKKEVESKMQEYIDHKICGPSEQVTFNRAFNEWFHTAEYRIKESTAANYTLKADKHILPQFSDVDIGSIKQDDIYKFIKNKQEVGLSNRYITDILILMKSVFKYAARVYRAINPMEGLVMPKKEKTEIQLLSAAEEEKLMRILTENLDLSNMGIALAKMTGLRIGELCALRWQDIDLEKRILTVRNTLQRVKCKGGSTKTKLLLTAPKSETSKRIIPIPECMIEILKQFLGKPDEFILSNKTKPIEPRTMQYRFVKILKNGNLPSVHFHALRHMFASKCVKLGLDVKTLSEILGHSGVEITLNRYVHSSIEQKIEFMDHLKMAG